MQTHDESGVWWKITGGLVSALMAAGLWIWNHVTARITKLETQMETKAAKLDVDSGMERHRQNVELLAVKLDDIQRDNSLKHSELMRAIGTLEGRTSRDSAA